MGVCIGVVCIVDFLASEKYISSFILSNLLILTVVVEVTVGS
jgi:hypothetical protein